MMDASARGGTHPGSGGPTRTTATPRDDPPRRAIEATGWSSAITDYDEEHVWVRGLRLDEAVGNLGFGGMVLLLWTGERPDRQTERLFEGCLAASVDHGPVTPSATVARVAASVRQHPVAAVAAGLLTVTQYHGGAVTPCMEVLGRHLDTADDAATWARRITDEHVLAGQRVPGIGHRVHTVDRRALRLLELADEVVPDAPYVERVRALSDELSERAGRPITVNIDGAVAACLVSIGLEPEYGTLAFAIARSAGLAAHVVEERTRQRPMRTISPEQVDYDGPRPSGTPPPEER